MREIIKLLQEKKILLLYLATIVLLFVFSDRVELISILKKINWLYLLLFVLSCYLAAFSPIITEKNLAKGIAREYEDEISFRKNRFDMNNLSSLLILFLCSLIVWILSKERISVFLASVPGIFIIIIILFSKQNILLFRHIIRYLLEMPKIYFSFLLIQVNPEFYLVLWIITIGSMLYFVVPRGIFIFDIFIAVLFLILGYSLIQYILFIVLNRILGAAIIVVPFSVLKYNKDNG